MRSVRTAFVQYHAGSQTWFCVDADNTNIGAFRNFSDAMFACGRSHGFYSLNGVRRPIAEAYLVPNPRFDTVRPTGAAEHRIALANERRVVHKMEMERVALRIREREIRRRKARA